MIPVKLVMRNFMPYREDVPPLYFTDIHTASVSGDNGNGKSAIVDAITWALWGKARAKSDDDLIHLGQDEMEVEFEFKVGGQGYRVIRKRTRPRTRRAAGQSSLEFQIASENGFSPITGNTIRETEQKIVDTLHMKYDTFVNSAFLRQGHADEFTVSSPADRKKVLADILDLSYYDQLEGLARSKVREKENEKVSAESSIREINTELGRKQEYESALEQAAGRLAEVESVLKEKESALRELRREKESLDLKGKQLSEIEERIGKSAQELERRENLLGQQRALVEEYEQIIDRRAEIEQSYATFTASRDLVEEMNQKLRAFSTLRERRGQLLLVIETESNDLKNQHSNAQRKITELEARAQQLPGLRAARQQARVELERLSGEEKALEGRKESRQQLQQAIFSLESEIKSLESGIAEADEKLAMLTAQTGARCPLCQQELGEEHRREMEQQFTDEKHQQAGDRERKQAELAQRRSELASISAELPRLEAELKNKRETARTGIGRVEGEIEQIEEAAAGLAEEKENLSEIEERMAARDYAPAEQQALGKIEEELAALGYDGAGHDEARQQMESARRFEAPRRELENAERNIERERTAAADSEKAVADLKAGLEADTENQRKLAAELASQPELAGKLEAAEREYQELGERQKQAREEVGGIRASLQRIAELEDRARERQDTLDRAAGEEAVYRDLVQAFGGRGIQAWLIEIALPEIEDEANRLLGRMTDNRMKVKFETQRESRAGDTLETLDIRIADELGTRNYEMYSGGEAFRINFAIRIALSKLLARRSGAPLPTLIIDEGFGTQDNTGLEKLKEAIISIQDDFQKILVITHIEDLRDAFPTRIEVVKTPEGSTIEVN